MGFEIKSIDVWNQLKKTKIPIILYGAGGQGQRLFKYLKSRGINPTCFCESNDNKKYKLLGADVLSYSQMKKIYAKYILIISVLPKKGYEIIQYLIQNKEKNSFIPMCMPFKIEDIFIDEHVEEKQFENLKYIYNFLEDDISKRIFNKLINFKRTGDGINLLEEISGDSFFEDSILKCNPNYCYIDCGAYTGDTITKFIQFNGLRYNKIIGVEMEKGNYKALMKFIRYSKLNNVNLYNVALNDKNGYTKYFTKSNYHFFNANIFREFEQVSSIQEKKQLKNNNAVSIEEHVRSITLDKIMELEKEKGVQFKNTIIKLNAMGADYKIINGSHKLISKHKPIFIIDYATFPQHIIDIPLLLKNINKEYKFYLRQKNIFGDSKSVLYCV